MAYVPKRAAARGTAVQHPVRQLKQSGRSSDPPPTPPRKTRSDKRLVTSVKDPEFKPRTLQQKLAMECGVTTTVIGRHLKKGLSPDEVRLYYKRVNARGGSVVVGPATPTSTPQQSVGIRPERKSHSADGRVWVRDEQTGEDRLENEYEAKARKERALATEREIKVAMALQTLIPRVQVTQVIGGALIQLRDSLMRIPVEMRDTLALIDDPVRIDELLRQALGVRLEQMQQAVRKFSEELKKEAEETALKEEEAA